MQNLTRPSPLAELTSRIAQRGEVPLVVVRHGRTASNVERRFVGRTDVPLDEAGHAEVAQMAARVAPLPRAALYASPLLRARQTAAALGEALLDPDLQELDQGELEGMRFHDALPRYGDFFQAWDADPTHVRVPGGESMGDCQARGLRAMARIGAAHEPGDPVVIVSHKMLICSLVLGAVGVPLRAFRTIPMHNTAINLFGWSEAGGLQLYRFNDRRHLC